MTALDDFVRRAASDCVNARWYTPDIGMCDLCGSEDGERRRVLHAGCWAWLCGACVPHDDGSGVEG